MDIFIELTATIMQNFLIIWFISGYCGYKYNGIKRYISFGIILLADCVFVSIINKFISYSFKSIKLSYFAFNLGCLDISEVSHLSMFHFF